MKIMSFAVLFGLPLGGFAVAQPAPPAAPRPCVLMPRQGPPVPPATGRPRERCAVAALPRAERAGR